MNNKGQVLVVFVLFLPILFLILAALVELGDLLVYKNRLENNAKYIVEYGVKNLDDIKIKEKLETLNSKNLDGKAKITVTEKNVTLSLLMEKEKVFSFIVIPLTVEFTYKGNMREDKVYIRKE